MPSLGGNGILATAASSVSDTSDGQVCAQRGLANCNSFTAARTLGPSQFVEVCQTPAGK